MSEIAFKSAQKSSGKYRKTGALYQSLYNRLTVQPGGRRVGHDTNRAPHAKYILWGTPDHDIAPKNKKALRWVGPGGAYFFSKGHKVKGIKADQYLLRAADDASAAFRSIVDKSFKESI